MVGVLLASPWWAQAQPVDEQRAAALALFDEGRTLMQAERYDEACPKLEHSLRLVPGTGTRFNLAECYERTGKLASAWLLYREVLAAIAREQDRTREQAVRARIQALEPRVSRLQLDMSERPDGLIVRRDGRVVDAAVWGTAVPVDPGVYQIEADAKGYDPWRAKVQVVGEGSLRRVRIALRPSVAASERADMAGAEASCDDAGWAMLGAGLGLGVLSAVLLGVGYSQMGSADETCPTRQCADEDAVDLGQRGRSTAIGGYFTTALGGTLALVGAAVLVVPRLTGSDVDDVVQPVGVGKLRLRAAASASAVAGWLDVVF